MNTTCPACTRISISQSVTAMLSLAFTVEALALVPVTQPNFSVPEVGYYGCWVYPNGGWMLITGNPGDANANPCLGATGAMVKRTGMYSTTGVNIAEAWCEPNFYWIYEGAGTGPLGAAFGDASETRTGGFCYFNVTVGDSPRSEIRFQNPPLPLPSNAYPRPDPSLPYAFNIATFLTEFRNAFSPRAPLPVGYQIAIRSPEGALLYSEAEGSVTGNSGLPATTMTTARRLDVASMSKTITATALVAALEDLEEHVPDLGISLDSSIAPFLPSNWNRTKVAQVTFRSLLRHTAGFDSNDDYYANLKTVIENGPSESLKGDFHYRNCNYALMRLLIPYVVDGPAAYKPFESNAAKNAQITGLSYRNYVRGRIFGPLGLGAVDLFHTGPLPETIYFTSSRQAIPDNLNIPGYDPNVENSGYDMTANNHVLSAGSGNWTLSAEEYSLFISRLWGGRIISQASLNTMMPRDDQVAINVNLSTATGLGIFGSRVALDGVERWNYNEAGGGFLGGPQGIWMTLFNGYTIVFLSNTPGNFGGKDLYRVMEDSALPAFRPVITFQPPVHDLETGVTTLAWTSQPGAAYSIERSADLVIWRPVQSGHPSGGTVTTYSDRTGSTSVRFYRILYQN